MALPLEDQTADQAHPRCNPLRAMPDQIYVVRGQGSHVWDVRGKEFIDFISARGASVLGYAHPAVTEAVTRQLAQGVLVSLAYLHCVKLFEKLTRLVPCAEMVEIRKTGSEATAAAVRLARAYTQRDLVIRCGYHGWHDWCANGFGVIHPSNRCQLRQASNNVPGVPQAVSALTLNLHDPNDLDSLEEMLRHNAGKVACLIIDPSEIWPPIGETLATIRDLTQQQGVILIFDEVKTSLRVALGGVQERFGVVPDMATLSKGLGNGFPITAVVGRKEIMKMSEQSPLWSTFSVEAVSVAAAVATLNVLEKTNGVAQLWAMGQRLIDGINSVITQLHLQEEVEAQPWNVAPMPFVWFKGSCVERREAMRERFYRELTQRGILMLSDHMNFINLGHSVEDIDVTIAACESALRSAKDA